MRNFDLTLQGPKNRMKETTGFIQWFSFSFETGILKRKLEFISAHFWILGFQIFEFSLYRKKED